VRSKTRLIWSQEGKVINILRQLLKNKLFKYLLYITDYGNWPIIVHIK